MVENVILREITTACGRRFGHATLNSEKTLNALSLEMIDRLLPQMQAWAIDPGVAGVLLDGAGAKAFCAGGDVAALYRAVKAAPAGVVTAQAKAFFEHEYRLDYCIHTYPKPVLCWGNGIVMGGGIGLLAGASHRVVTPDARLAMPEITIGLYPDVGGSWFLRRIPGQAGLFLALTGASLNASDVRFAGLADFVLPGESKEALVAALSATHWHDPAAGDEANRAQLSHLLERYALDNGLPESALRKHFDVIDRVVGHDRLLDIDGRVRALCEHPDAWLAAAGKTYAKGAPGTAAISHALWRRARHLSLVEVFRLEYQVSVACTTHADFIEGVRALLIDKDRNPTWQHAHVSEIGADFIAEHLDVCPDARHPLLDMG